MSRPAVVIEVEIAGCTFGASAEDGEPVEFYVADDASLAASRVGRDDFLAMLEFAKMADAHQEPDDDE